MCHPNGSEAMNSRFCPLESSAGWANVALEDWRRVRRRLERPRTMGMGDGVRRTIPTARTQGNAVFGPLERVSEVREPFMADVGR